MKRLFRLQYNAPVTLTFALVSLAALLLGKLTNGWTDTYLFSVWHSSLSDILTYPRFFLHVLGHVDYDHYIGNMMMILVVGPGLEEKYGSRNLLSAIVITALVLSLKSKPVSIRTPCLRNCSSTRRCKTISLSTMWRWSTAARTPWV